MNLLFITAPLQRSGTNFLGRVVLSSNNTARPSGPWEWVGFRYSKRILNYANLSYKYSKRFMQEPGVTAKIFGDGMLAYWEDFIDDNERDKKYLVQKVPQINGVENISSIFPNAKTLIIVREGKDTINSVIRAATKQKTNTFRRRYLFIKYCLIWTKNVQSILKGRFDNNSLLVKYEDLNLNTEENLKLLNEYLEFNMNDFHEWREKVNSLSVRGSGFYKEGEENMEHSENTNWNDETKTNSFNPIGRHKKYFSRLDHLIFSLLAGKTNQKLGYTS